MLCTLQCMLWLCGMRRTCSCLVSLLQWVMRVCQRPMKLPLLQQLLECPGASSQKCQVAAMWLWYLCGRQVAVTWRPALPVAWPCVGQVAVTWRQVVPKGWAPASQGHRSSAHLNLQPP